MMNEKRCPFCGAHELVCSEFSDAGELSEEREVFQTLFCRACRSFFKAKWQFRGMVRLVEEDDGGEKESGKTHRGLPRQAPLGKRGDILPVREEPSVDTSA